MQTSTREPKDEESLGQTTEKELFKDCKAAMEALMNGSRQRYGVTLFTQREIELGDGLKIELNTVHSNKTSLSGCFLYEWSETNSKLLLTFNKKVVFDCKDYITDNPNFTSWFSVFWHIPGAWEKDIDALLQITDGGNVRKPGDIDKHWRAFLKVKEKLEKRDSGFISFHDAVRKE